MTDRDKLKLFKGGFNIFKIFGIPAKEIRGLSQYPNGELHFTKHSNYKTVGATKEAFEILMQDDKNIDGAGL
jgi:hypothetical protein